MPEDDHNAVALLTTRIQPVPDQSGTDAAPLVFGPNSNGGQGQRWHNPIVRENWQVAERNVADNDGIGLGDKRNAVVPALAQGIDEVGLVVLSEREAMNVVYGRAVSAGLAANGWRQRLPFLVDE